MPAPYCCGALAGILAGAHIAFFLALALAAAQLAWQVATLDTDDAGNCLARFKSNQLVGWLLFLGLVADMGLAAPARRSRERSTRSGAAGHRMASRAARNARSCQLLSSRLGGRMSTTVPQKASDRLKQESK